MIIPNKRTLTRLVKLAVSVAYFVGSRASNLGRRLAGLPAPGTCTILYYHSITPDNRERFGRQLDMLARLSTPIGADTRERLSSGVRYAAVTFDDALENLIDNALPELQKRHIPCTIFVIAGTLGEIPWWTAKAARPENRHRTMTADQLRSLSAELVVLGAHTLTHPNLLAIPEADGRREIAESRTRLEKILGRDVRLFSFPFGAFDERLVDYCREAGYERVFTTLPHPALSEPHEFVSGRVCAEPTDWPLEYRLKLAGAYSWLPAAFRLKRRLLRRAGAQQAVGKREDTEFA